MEVINEGADRKGTYEVIAENSRGLIDARRNPIMILALFASGIDPGRLFR